MILTSNAVTDEVPELTPVSLGSLVFTRRGSQKASRGSRSQDSGVNLSEFSPPPPPSDLGSSDLLRASNSRCIPKSIVREDQSSSTIPTLPDRAVKSHHLPFQETLTGDLRKQAIRQKVREVSAKQQSINDNNRDEAYRQSAPSSILSSAFSYQTNKTNQVSGCEESNLDIQYSREGEHQPKLEIGESNSTAYEPHDLIYDGEHEVDRSPRRALSTFQTLPPPPISVEAAQSDTADPFPLHAALISAFTIPDSSRVLTDAHNHVNKHRSLVNFQDLSPTSHEPRTYSIPAIRLEDFPMVKTREAKEEGSQATDQLQQPGYLDSTHTPPHQSHGLSPQEHFRQSSRDLTVAEDQHLSTQMPSYGIVDSYRRPGYKGNTREDQAHVAGQFGQHMPSQHFTGTYLTSQQQLQCDSAVDRQVTHCEDQSPFAKAEYSQDHQHSRAEHTHNHSRPFNEQLHLQSTLSQSLPKAMDRFADLKQGLASTTVAQTWEKASDDPFTDTARSSSTLTPANHAGAASAHLRGASPAFIPSDADPVFMSHSSNAGPTAQSMTKAPLPAVKGTGYDLVHRQQTLPQSYSATDGAQDDDHFSKPRTLALDVMHNQKPTRSRPEESVHRGLETKATSQHSRPLMAVTGKTMTLRDPMPYTGYTASNSKKEQLLGSLNKTIDEAKAKGDLSSSNRSVLFDPVASSARVGNSSDVLSENKPSDFQTTAGSMNQTSQTEGMSPSLLPHRKKSPSFSAFPYQERTFGS